MSPSHREGIDYTKDITVKARTGVFLLLGQLPSYVDIYRWFSKVGDDFVHLHQDFIYYFNTRPDGLHGPLLAFDKYLRQPSTKSVAFLDFLECAFRSDEAERDNELIRSINLVLEVNGCPYRLTEFVMSTIEHGQYVSYAVKTFPMVYLAQGSAVEVHAIKPMLALFTDPDFDGPGEFFREALKRHKNGNYSGCVTSCAAAVESSIKVVAGKNRWRVKGSGVGGCTQSFLLQSKLPKKLQSVADFIAERRQNIGDAHGQVAVPEATEAEARFLIGLSAAFIVFLSSEIS